MQSYSDKTAGSFIGSIPFISTVTYDRMRSMTDDDMWDTIKSLYDEGKGIGKIAKALHSSHHRIGRILREHGVDTLARTSYCRERRNENHPFSLFEVMETKKWSNLDVALKLGVDRKRISEWRAKGLDIDKADELALAMGYMPQDLWDNWWEHC